MEATFLSIAAAARLLRRRELSPVELTRACLERTDQLNGKLNAYVTVTADAALAAAAAAEREMATGAYLGPLHGIPLAAKDLFHTAGVRTGAGSKFLADFVPARDATAIARLKAAGAILLGKTNTHEFAFGITTNNPHTGPTHNPWQLGLIPGGSSGGSGAALAAGLCLAATGTDTGGSIRIPASLCGITGIKPSFGRVSRHGVVPLSWSMDHIGPMARTVEDCALLLQAMAGADRLDSQCLTDPVPDYRRGLHRGIAGWRCGVPAGWATENLHPEVAAAFQQALRQLEALGAAVVEVDLPHIKEAYPAYSAVGMPEAANYHAEWLAAHPQAYGEDVRHRLMTGTLVLATEYLKGQQVRSLLSQEMLAALAECDLLVTPATAIPAAPIGAEALEAGGRRITVREGLTRFTIPFNMTGLPCLALPMGFTATGLPLGLQIAGPPLAEAAVLRAGAAYEAATDWHQRRPAL